MPTSFQIQTTNNSVLLLKEKDVILTNDHWRLDIDLDTSRYEDVISSTRSDLLIVSKQQKEFTPISELKQIEMLLNIFESRLLYFQHMVPKLDSRRSYFEFWWNSILTNDHWRVNIDLDTSRYEDVILSIRSDLMVVSKQQKEFTPICDLKQIEMSLNVLESRLLYFQHMLPKLDSGRGILNFGCTILQTLFGIATVADLHMLHDTLDELKSKDIDIAHSLANQVTYVKRLDHTVRVYSDAILNLSTILKNEMIQSHDKYQQFITDISLELPPCRVRWSLIRFPRWETVSLLPYTLK
jgi:hypothetical protein